MRVRIERDPRGIAIKPMTRMGAYFESYQECCRGASYDRERSCQVAAAELASVIVERLLGEKFEVELAPDVVDLIRSNIADVGMNVEDAKERVIANAKSLYPFQRQGAVKVSSRRRFMLSDEMGLGKTRQEVFAAPENAPILVVCPAIAKGVWRKEFNALRPEFDVTVINGKNRFRWPRPGEVVVINYDITPPAVLGPCKQDKCKNQRRYGKTTCTKHRERKFEVQLPVDECILCGNARHEGTDCLEIELGGLIAPNGLFVIADEAHMLKTKKSKRTQSFRNISNVARLRNGWVHLVTGTPLMNRIQELWDLLECADLAREVFGTYDEFVKIFGGKKNFFGGFDFPSLKDIQIADSVIDKLSRVMLRRARAVVMPDLPPKVYDDIEVDLSSVADKECDKAIRDAHVDISDPKFLDKIPFADGSRLRKNIATVKIPFMVEFVESYEDAEEPLIVFCAHSAPLKWFKNRKGWEIIDGETQSERRFEIAEEFRAGKLIGVAGSIKAMGVGIRFERAAHALFVDLEWTPALNQQAEDRLQGVTQTKKVMIHRLIGAHKLERRIAELCEIKSALIAATVEKVSDDTEVSSAGFAETVDFASLIVDRGNVIQVTDRAKAAGGTNKVIGRRQAKTPLEVWTADSLRKLAGLDADFARQRNNVGFMRSDTATGHSLAQQLQEGLTDLQWKFAAKMCRIYWRQVGAPPEG